MKVLIADDHALFRDGLGMRLEQIDPNVVILQASSFRTGSQNSGSGKENRPCCAGSGYARHALGGRFGRNAQKRPNAPVL